MNIETKFDVGYEFWVPRCRKTFRTETLHFEGEVWNRKIPDYSAYSKKKIIIGIDIRTDSHSTNIFYSVVDSDNRDSLSQVYAESDITNYTEAEALQIAQKYKDREQEYFGN